MSIPVTSKLTHWHSGTWNISREQCCWWIFCVPMWSKFPRRICSVSPLLLLLDWSLVYHFGFMLCRMLMVFHLSRHCSHHVHLFINYLAAKRFFINFMVASYRIAPHSCVLYSRDFNPNSLPSVRYIYIRASRNPTRIPELTNAVFAKMENIPHHVFLKPTVTCI